MIALIGSPARPTAGVTLPIAEPTMRTFHKAVNQPQPGRGGENTDCHDSVSAMNGSSETAGMPTRTPQPSPPTWSATALRSDCARTNPKRTRPSARKSKRNDFMCDGQLSPAGAGCTGQAATLYHLQDGAAPAGLQPQGSC